VPSGDSPDGTATSVCVNEDGLLPKLRRAVPVGGSPTGAGKLPALPIFQTRSDLLYRRFPIGRRLERSARPKLITARRLEALRYSRLEICATHALEQTPATTLDSGLRVSKTFAAASDFVIEDSFTLWLL
jgi:hypothetical protein